MGGTRAAFYDQPQDGRTKNQTGRLFQRAEPKDRLRPSPMPNPVLRERLDMSELTNLHFACSHCGGMLEFPNVCENGTVNCYHCGMSTWLQKGKRAAQSAGRAVSTTGTNETAPIKAPIPASAGNNLRKPSTGLRSTLIALVWISLVGFLVGFGVVVILKQGRPPFRFHSATPDLIPAVHSSVHRTQTPAVAVWRAQVRTFNTGAFPG